MLLEPRIHALASFTDIQLRTRAEYFVNVSDVPGRGGGPCYVRITVLILLWRRILLTRSVVPLTRGRKTAWWEGGIARDTWFVFS